MERTDETLSTRDLASTSDRAVDSAGASGEAAPSEVTAAPRDQEVAVAPRDQEELAAAPAADASTSSSPADIETKPSTPSGSTATVESAPSSGSAPAVQSDYTATSSGSASEASPATSGSDEEDRLLPGGDAGAFRQRWEEIQTQFVDEPRGAVEDADGLVAALMQQLAEGFAKERERLEAQWGRGEDISTEDLRVALQRYRSFFERLLST